MLFLPVLLLLSGLPRGASADGPTYEHPDPITKELLNCTMCPPGTHMVSHCTATTETQCKPCRAEHFTELYNYLPRCLYCNNLCTGNQEVEADCSPLSNRVCRCKEGFYWADDFCMVHSECGSGQGVQTKGTRQTDTVCEKCSDGSFSSSSSALDTCVRHQECAGGQAALHAGSVYHDTVCGTCEDLANGGETLRTFLSGFFSAHRMRGGRMKKFVNRYIQRSGEERCSRDTTLSKQRGPLLDLIKAWLARAPEEQLKKMPQMLKTSQLSAMAEKLEKRLREIKLQSPDCSLTVAEA